jgi:hypothetical protein
MKIIKDTLYLRKEDDKIINSNNTTGFISDNDWFLTIPIYKSTSSDGYVVINKDNFIYKIERQNINPYFYELGFFETIEQIGYNEQNIKFFYDIIITNEFNLTPSLFASIYNSYKKSLELKSNFFNIPISPDPLTSDEVNALTKKMNELKELIENNQENFSQESLENSNNQQVIIKTEIVLNVGDYIFSNEQPVPINTILNFLDNGKIVVAEGIYKNFEVFNAFGNNILNVVE